MICNPVNAFLWTYSLHYTYHQCIHLPTARTPTSLPFVLPFQIQLCRWVLLFGPLLLSCCVSLNPTCQMMHFLLVTHSLVLGIWSNSWCDCSAGNVNLSVLYLNDKEPIELHPTVLVRQGGHKIPVIELWTFYTINMCSTSYLTYLPQTPKWCIF